MILAYVIGTGAATQVTAYLPWFMLAGRPGEPSRGSLMGAGWIIDAVVAEAIIRRGRRERTVGGDAGGRAGQSRTCRRDFLDLTGSKGIRWRSGLHSATEPPKLKAKADLCAPGACGATGHAWQRGRRLTD